MAVVELHQTSVHPDGHHKAQRSTWDTRRHGEPPQTQRKSKWRVVLPCVPIIFIPFGFNALYDSDVEAVEGIVKQDTRKAQTAFLTPPNLGPKHPTHEGYYQMPTSTDGSYEFNKGTCPNQRWGSPELITALERASKRWNEETNGGEIIIGDLNAGKPHKAHQKGTTADLNAQTGGGEGAANIEGTRGKYSADATITLGKILLDTKMVKQILFEEKKNPRVIKELNKYALKNKLTPSEPVRSASGHTHHFHVEVMRQDKKPLEPLAPDC